MIIAQISDSHIGEAGGGVDRSFATADHLQRAVAHLLRLPAPPDVVLITGDCVNGGGMAEYERFRELVRPLTMPVFVVPGNHDHRERMLEVFGSQGAAPLDGFVQYVVDGWPVRLIGLDTNIPGQGAGQLCATRLGWLAERLAEAPERPTLIFLHHPPFATGMSSLDDLGLSGAEELGALVARYPNVERIVAGHVHMALQRRFHGTLAMTCPSTAHQLLFDLRHPQRLEAIMQPPACLLHVWHERAGLLTYSSPIGEYAASVETA